MTSRPARIGGMQPRCTGVGFDMPMATTLLLSHWFKPNARNEASPETNVLSFVCSGFIRYDISRSSLLASLPSAPFSVSWCALLRCRFFDETEKREMPPASTPSALKLDFSTRSRMLLLLSRTSIFIKHKMLAQ